LVCVPLVATAVLPPPAPVVAPRPVSRTPAVVAPRAPEVGRRSAGEVAADLAERLHGDNVRFLWQTDAAHRFVKITGELCDLVGCMTSRLVGRSFLDVADELGLDPEAKLRDALHKGETWSGLEILWPVEQADAAFPMTLGALPAYDRNRHFEGFRGFGVIHVTQLQEIEAAPQAPEMPEPVPEFEPEQAAGPGSLMPEPEAQPKPSQPKPAPIAPAPERVAPAPPAPGPVGNVVKLRPLHLVPRREPIVPPVTPPPAPSQAVPAPAAGSPLPEVPEPADSDMVSLTPGERLAFREIARALGASVRDDKDAPASGMGPPHVSVRDLIEVATRLAVDDPILVPLAPAPLPVAPPDFPEDVQRVLDRLPLGVLVSRDSRPLFANRTMIESLGYADWAQFFREDGLTRMFRGRSRLEVDAEEHGSIQLAARDGASVAFEARIQKIEWDGAPASLMTFRRPHESPELAARIRALESDLRASEAGVRELHAVLDTATDGVVVLDEDGRVMALNRAGEALFGFEQSDVEGQSFTILFARESQPVALDYFAAIRGSGVASVLNDGRDVTGRARQGGAIPLFMMIGKIGSNGASKFCAVLRDLTAWKTAEQELKDARQVAEQANALKSDFLAKVSHEIRTPLNAILGFTEVIMEERFGPVANERYKEYLQDIHTSGAHVMSLVNDLLDLSKIEAGKLELNFGAVDANRIVAECVSLIQPQAARERVVVRQSLAQRLPNIVADERALRQIVLNLLSNAVKFNEPGGQVIVSTALTDAGHAVVRIRDTGIGMSESEIETALEPFRQIANSRGTRGTGLGLPLTKALIDANRASFSIKSKKAEGTLVEVAFPPTRVLAE
jgi:PAS domain S-box-containing protein